MAKRKIAVLGGGVGAISTIYGLTSKPGWQDEYEITLHQVGWRMGGKGASGRGPNGRIQEHGLHILLGFYENAFRMLRDIYAQVEGESGVFRSFDDAFTGQNTIGLMDEYEGEWSPWLFDFPVRPGKVGDGNPKHYDDVWEIIVQGCSEAILWAEAILKQHSPDLSQRHDATGSILDRARALGHIVDAKFESAAQRGLLHLLHWAVSLAPDVKHQKPHHHGLIAHILDKIGDELRHLLETSSIKDVRRVAQALDMGCAIVKGIMDNAALIDAKGLNELDGDDLQDWLKRYGASDLAAEVSKSAPVRALYDLSFAFENGDTSKPNFAAGNALRALFCLGMLYKGSVFHEMNAGMGDTIFAPAYKAFLRKGVKIEFFHDVTNLEMNEVDGTKVIESISISQQVDPRQPYQPFVRVQGLDCWPQAPLTDQLADGDALKAGPDGNGTAGWNGLWQGFDLENPWSGWNNHAKIVLQRGVDFDEVVLAIPPMSHPLIARDAVAAIPAWQNMVTSVKSVRTQAVQLWMNKDLKDLGWREGPTVVDAFVDPLNTWADMSHLLCREDWPQDSRPKNIAYFCGPMLGGLPAGAENPMPEAQEQVAKTAKAWLEQAPGWLWPGASTNGALNRSVLDTASGGGEGRLEGQYWRANIFPSEFYVLSTKGSNAARLDAHELPVANLYFAGDWTDNGFNGGCVEAAVISGLRASHAISGFPELSSVESYW